jgi:hypothetical protein
MTRILLFLVILCAQFYSAQALPNKKNAPPPRFKFRAFSPSRMMLEKKSESTLKRLLKSFARLSSLFTGPAKEFL